MNSFRKSVVLSIVLLTVTTCILGVTFANSSLKEKDNETTRNEHPDNPTPEVRIVSPADGAVIKGNEVPIEIETRNFEFAYNKATKQGTATTTPEKYASLPQEPNSGHVHVYLGRYPRAVSTGTDKFFMVQSFVMPNKASFSLKDVPPGRYRLLVELVRHDHGPRIKNHPRDWPPLDMISLTVE